MQYYDDDNGTGRGVISHATSLHFALTMSIDPTGKPTIMTRTPASGVVV